jgi:hypothetical protein
MRFPRAAGFTVLLIAGIGLLAVIGLLLHEWWLSTPSEAAKKLEAVYQERRPLPDADNAWFDLYGFAAPAEEDPRALGAQRIDWMKRVLGEIDPQEKDPGPDRIELKDHRSPVLARITDACIRRPGLACAEAMKLNVDGAALSTMEPLLSARYQAMLDRAGAFALVEYDVSQPLPNYDLVMEAQRLLLLRLQGAARHGDVTQVRETLQRDHAFWRRMMATSEVLIDRMIAVSGIRQNFAFGNFALRELPRERQLAAIPPSWRTPFGAQELSLRRVMAAEFHFALRISRMPGYDPTLYETYEDELARLIAKVPGFRNTQRELNRIAAAYWQVANDFDVPLDQYLAAHQRFEQSLDNDNATGRVSQYALRSGSVEGMRRAVLATTELRARSVPSSGMAEALRAARWRDPYDGKAFTWNARERSVAFEAPESSRYTLLYFY